MDNNVEIVIAKHRERERRGLRKYGVNTQRPDYRQVDWLIELQQELMDAAVYIQAYLSLAQLARSLAPTLPGGGEKAAVAHFADECVKSIDGLKDFKIQKLEDNHYIMGLVTAQEMIKLHARRLIDAAKASLTPTIPGGGEKDEPRVCKFYHPEPCPLPNVHCSAPDCKVPLSKIQPPEPSSPGCEQGLTHQFWPLQAWNVGDSTLLTCRRCEQKFNVMLVLTPDPKEAQS